MRSSKGEGNLDWENVSACGIGGNHRFAGKVSIVTQQVDVEPGKHSGAGFLTTNKMRCFLCSSLVDKQSLGIGNVAQSRYTIWKLE